VEQIAVADRLILNKMDLIDAKQKDAVVSALRVLNPRAKILFCERAGVKTESLVRTNNMDYVNDDANSHWS
jgi:G3E family GTPase